MSDTGKARRPLIEWVFGLLAGCAVLALLAFLAFQALFASSRAPELVVTVTRIERQGAQSLVHFQLANRGDRAASAVGIRVGARQAQWHSVEFDYVAPHSQRQGAVVLPAELADQASIHVSGFAEP